MLGGIAQVSGLDHLTMEAAVIIALGEPTAVNLVTA